MDPVSYGSDSRMWVGGEMERRRVVETALTETDMMHGD